MQMARGDFQREREDDFQFRQDADRIDRVGGAVQAAHDELDYVPRMRTINQEDIDAECQTRSCHIGDVDRAAKVVASINEADLIRGGIDVRTTGTVEEAVAARLAGEYSDARESLQRAVDYILARQVLLTQLYL